jgi:hypothetical protein
MLLVCAAVALSTAGCARHREMPPSLKDVPAAIEKPVRAEKPEKPVRAEKPEKLEKAETPEKDLRDWCAKRHVDRQQGRPPGGAHDQEQVEAGNRVCGEVYRYPGYLEP